MKCLAITFIQDEIIGRRSASSSSVATSVMDDTSPESAVGKKSESGIISTSLKDAFSTTPRTVFLRLCSF